MTAAKDSRGLRQFMKSEITVNGKMQKAQILLLPQARANAIKFLGDYELAVK